MAIAVTHRIPRYDIVELTEAVGEAPSGARGGVLECHDDNTAMVEFISLPSEAEIDRIVVVPLDKLQLVDARAAHSA